jgi:hypothetical protein
VHTKENTAREWIRRKEIREILLYRVGKKIVDVFETYVKIRLCYGLENRKSYYHEFEIKNQHKFTYLKSVFVLVLRVWEVETRQYFGRMRKQRIIKIYTQFFCKFMRLLSINESDKQILATICINSFRNWIRFIGFIQRNFFFIC